MRRCKERMNFHEYIQKLQKNLAYDSREHTHRPALKTLVESAAKGIEAVNEPAAVSCGSPDFHIYKRNIRLGYIETKDIGTNLDEIEKGKGPHGEQFLRYRALPNWILTDYLEFRWFVFGEKRETWCVADFVRGKVKPIPNAEDKLFRLFNSFFDAKVPTVGTALELAQRMARMTQNLRDLLVKTFEHETEKGWLHNWLSAFRVTLIPDLDEKQFADMFAQTLAYGLFAARVHTPESEDFTRKSAAYAIPKTNPFLRKLFSEIGGVDMPDTIAWAVDDIVELLNHADLAEVLKDFGKGKGKEDPVVHFYETFLAAYDPKMRELRGVYYTPEPVVSYIVRSIDHLLKTRFNRPKGLADENALILDPATGTATFLYFVVDQIHQKFAKQKGAWDGYVSKHLLNRIFGFELLVAPYSVAHLKLGMQLQETGYQFGSDQRLGIYLTNTLEEAAKKTEQLFQSWIADEANAAAKIKRDDPILVVLGNPPYSKFSANRSQDEEGELTFIGELIEDYKVVDGKPLGERNPKWLQDDYVKFVRFAQWRIDKTEEGVVGLITNHGYLDNPTFRGMRRSLMQSFNEIYIYNLHGNIRKAETAPDGTADENVFDIQQGVSIILCTKQKGKEKTASVRYADLWGSRAGKYESLAENNLKSTMWTKIVPTTPLYLFVPQDTARRTEYEKAWLVPHIFNTFASTVTTARNDFSMAYDPETLVRRINDLKDKSTDDETLRTKYGLKDVSYWTLSQARKELFTLQAARDFVKPYCYRPFDFRFVFYHASVCERLRPEVMQHMFHDNLAFLTHRPQSPPDFTFAFCTKMMGDQCVAANKSVGGGNSFQFPLYLYDIEKKKKGNWGKAITMALFEPSAEYQTRRPNLSPAFLKALAEKLKLPQTQPHNLPKGITPEDIFHYAYAVFHAPTYRTRYAEFLKIDFPRLPLTSDLKLFRALAKKGEELVALHLMESKRLNHFLTTFPMKGSNEVEKVHYTDKDKRVWINAQQFFGSVPKAVWEFQIGGYQVCEKWLKDRKRRKLTYQDIEHYQKIVAALSETIRLMKEIDAAIPKWPIE